MTFSEINQLLQDLQNTDESIREAATIRLWQIWFGQKGQFGLELLRRAQNATERGNFAEAESILTETIESFPDFAEAFNRRAVLYYLKGDFEKSRLDCEEVIKLVRYHFGAWHGLGLCQAAMGNYREAIAAFRESLAIQPHALINQQLILECTAMLS